MMNTHDVFNLMFRLRGGLARDMYGIQNEGLFTRALGGTKYLIEDYHNTICEALDYICDSQQDEVRNSFSPTFLPSLDPNRCEIGVLQ